MCPDGKTAVDESVPGGGMLVLPAADCCCKVVTGIRVAEAPPPLL